MKLLHEQVIGGIVIAALVAFGLIIAEEPELPRLLNGPFFAQAPASSLSTVTVSHVEWSADSRKLLCQSRGGSSAALSLSVHDVSADTGFVPDWCDAFDGVISYVSLSPDGTSVVVASFLGELWWIDLETSAATELAKIPVDIPFIATAIGHDGRLMAGATNDGEIYVCEPGIGKTLRLASQRKRPVIQLRFSYDSQRILSSGTDGSVAVWDTDDGALLGEYPAHDNLPGAAGFLPGGNRVLSTTVNSALQIWEVADRNVQWRGAPASYGAFGTVTLDVTAGGNLAAWGNRPDRRIVVWDLETQQKRFEIENPSAVLELKFSPDGTMLAVAGRENVVRLYDMQTGLEIGVVTVGRPSDSASRI